MRTSSSGSSSSSILRFLQSSLSLSLLLLLFTGVGVGIVQAQNTNTDVNYALIPDTGQTKCTNPLGVEIDGGCDGSGQDGEYQTLSASYCVTEIKNATETAETTETVETVATVVDRITGLEWTQKAYGPMTILQASEPFEDQDQDGMNTNDDKEPWRLPTMRELYTLSQFYDDSRTGTSRDDNIPYLNADVFEIKYGPSDTGSDSTTAGNDRFIDGQLWSSNKYNSRVMGGQECYFGYNPIDGRIKCYPTNPIEAEKYVRYVRDSTTITTSSAQQQDQDQTPLYSIVQNSFGQVVRDERTRLEWTRYDSVNFEGGPQRNGLLNWAQALEYCEASSVAGFNDWKLPDAHELHSLVDYARSPDVTGSPALASIFESTPIRNEVGQVDYGYYWTSTTHNDGNPEKSNAVYIAFGRALGSVMVRQNDNDGNGNGNGNTRKIIDVHGAGAQRSDPKKGDPSQFPDGRGPQGDIVRIFNLARCVRRNKEVVRTVLLPCANEERIDTSDDFGQSSSASYHYYYYFSSSSFVFLLVAAGCWTLY